jgi:hypothetical protein
VAPLSGGRLFSSAAVGSRAGGGRDLDVARHEGDASWRAVGETRERRASEAQAERFLQRRGAAGESSTWRGTKAMLPGERRARRASDEPTGAAGATRVNGGKRRTATATAVRSDEQRLASGDRGRGDAHRGRRRSRSRPRRCWWRGRRCALDFWRRESIRTRQKPRRNFPSCK